MGTVVAPVLGSYVFFKEVGDNAEAIRNVQWVYLAIACFVFLLAVVFYFSTIPEITDADMMFQVGLLLIVISLHMETKLTHIRRKRRTLV